MKYVIGLFDDAADARIAEQKVSGMGRIEHLYGRESNTYSKLRGYGLSGSELDGFAEGVRRGGSLVVVHCDDKNAQAVANIFRGLPSVDINRRLERWRSTGFKGYDEKASFYSDADITRERERGKSELHVPVIEESISVGKREVERGGVRVETKTTEEPFQENVTLREEQVRVERRPVNRPVTAGDEIGDRSIEMKARGEEAVVQKQAKVVEEVVVKKEASARQETIRDTTKKTDVEVKPIAGAPRTSRSSLDRMSDERISRSSQL